MDEQQKRYVDLIDGVRRKALDIAALCTVMLPYFEIDAFTLTAENDRIDKMCDLLRSVERGLKRLTTMDD